MPRIALGADLSRGAWAVVRLRDGVFEDGGRVPTLAEALARFGGGAGLVGVDIPLGYARPGTKGRPCEREGRAILGSRRSTLFESYPAEVMDAPSYAEANAGARRLLGMGLPKQTYLLGAAIREARTLARTDARLREVHPELSFLALRGEPLAPKTTWSGLRQRLETLAACGAGLPVAWPALDGAAVDDVLDAAAAALTADRILRGAARRLPQDPSEDAIWI